MSQPFPCLQCAEPTYGFEDSRVEGTAAFCSSDCRDAYEAAELLVCYGEAPAWPPSLHRASLELPNGRVIGVESLHVERRMPVVGVQPTMQAMHPSVTLRFGAFIEQDVLSEFELYARQAQPLKVSIDQSMSYQLQVTDWSIDMRASPNLKTRFELSVEGIGL